MSEEMIPRPVRKKQVESDLRQIFEQTLPERIRRHLDITPHPIIAYHHFSAVSTECVNLYRDGHFYGCIALAQGVAEALAKFLCARNGWKPESDFEINIEKLHGRQFISDGVRRWFLEIWEKRNDYHHLNPTIEQVQRQLENMAKEKMDLLTRVEGDIFRVTFNEGKIIPTHTKYWDVNPDGTVPVYLRCK